MFVIILILSAPALSLGKDLGTGVEGFIWPFAM